MVYPLFNTKYIINGNLVISPSYYNILYILSTNLYQSTGILLKYHRITLIHILNNISF